VSGASPGGAAEAILAGPSADRFGRKKRLIADAGIHATGAIIPAVTGMPGPLIARTLIRVAIGGDSAIAPPTSPSTRRRTGAGR
jgi:MFS family permease